MNGTAVIAHIALTVVTGWDLMGDGMTALTAEIHAYSSNSGAGGVLLLYKT